MGKDNQPKHRQSRDLKRPRPNRMPADRILIITEGTKTEPFYFESIRRLGGIKTSNIKVLPGGWGTSCQNIVNYADHYIQQNNNWEAVYCVFDKDDDPSFLNAIQSAISKDKKFKNELKRQIRFYPIPSDPCFELWYLLHYRPVTTNFHRDEIFRMLHRTYIPGYEKNQIDIYEKTQHLLDQAYSHLGQLRASNDLDGNIYPKTDVDFLVMKLLQMYR